MLELFQNNLQPFSHSSLEESKAMSFLNRFDTKFVLKIENALDFLKSIQNDYSLLEINDSVIQSYKTVYFDTPDLLCFNLHHNKRANRFKFRTRQYLSNGKIFNEIKQKLNTGKTIKFRQRRDKIKEDAPNIPILKDFTEFDNAFSFLAHKNGYNFDNLVPSLFVFFNRITLLNKHFPERMTLDFGLKYGYNNEEFKLNNTAIVELKRERSPDRTVSQEFFRGIHKNPTGFSKYAIGVSLTHDEAKKNRFLPRIKKLTYERSSV
ncbi:MAG: polyphosphate polymerase domain-containing protein [Fibromonadales bacterium]|nr:polyphosphate polymerase domain-containing protein [Fibromonadales bacterium]